MNFPRGGEVRGGFKAVWGRGRGRDVRFECKVVVQVLGHGGIAKGEGGVEENFRWMAFGGEEKPKLSPSSKSLSYLRLAIHHDLQSQLNDNVLRGFRSESLEMCLMFLREIIFGPSWADEIDKYFERFRRKKVTIRQFQIDFEKVVVTSEYS